MAGSAVLGQDPVEIVLLDSGDCGGGHRQDGGGHHGHHTRGLLLLLLHGPQLSLEFILIPGIYRTRQDLQAPLDQNIVNFAMLASYVLGQGRPALERLSTHVALVPLIHIHDRRTSWIWVVGRVVNSFSFSPYIYIFSIVLFSSTCLA